MDICYLRLASEANLLQFWEENGGEICIGDIRSFGVELVIFVEELDV